MPNFKRDDVIIISNNELAKLHGHVAPYEYPAELNLKNARMFVVVYPIGRKSGYMKKCRINMVGLKQLDKNLNPMKVRCPVRYGTSMLF